MRLFRIYKTRTHVYVQHYQQTLFGMMWHALISFPIECESECKEVVRLLNKCSKKSQDNDTG